MIEINLIPEELKPKAKKQFKGFDTTAFKKNLPFIAIIPVLLIIVHLVLAVLLLMENSKLKGLNKQWVELQPQKRALEEFRKEFAMLSGDAEEIRRLTLARIIWSEKLNKLSLSLPSGVWFNELTVVKNDFVLKGSAVSLLRQKDEVAVINRFLNNLKNVPSFIKDFESLELSSVLVRVIGGQEVTDFVLAGKLKH